MQDVQSEEEKELDEPTQSNAQAGSKRKSDTKGQTSRKRRKEEEDISEAETQDSELKEQTKAKKVTKHAPKKQVKSAPKTKAKAPAKKSKPSAVDASDDGSDEGPKIAPTKKMRGRKVVDSDEEDFPEINGTRDQGVEKSPAINNEGKVAKTDVHTIAKRPQLSDESDLSELGESVDEQFKVQQKQGALSSKEKVNEKSALKQAREHAIVLSDGSDGEDQLVGTPALQKEAKLNNGTEMKPQAAKSGHVEESESELSSLIDEPPPKKKGLRKSPATSSKSKSGKTSKASKSSKSASAPEDPNEAEIKRLQSQLLKCGIRKLWHRELAPYDTSKAKIGHLRGMLRDVGMEGRFSVEKARLIRERRELEADLEAVQDFSQKWGKSGRETRRRDAVDIMRDLGFGSEGEEDD